MALANAFTITIPNNGLGVTAAHGLTHGGASRTPDFYVVMLNQGNTAATYVQLTVTYDSTSFVVSSQSAHLGITAQVFVKRCHTVEDRGSGIGATL